MTKGDKILIGSLLCLALLFYLGGKLLRTEQTADRIAVIRSEGQVVKKIDLNSVGKEEIKIKGPLGLSRAQLVEGEIKMLDSPCKDKICIKQGKIHSAKQNIVCVPNEVSISIESKGMIDEITK